jgi:proline iminopeptidase
MAAYKAIFDMIPANAADAALQLKAAVAWSVWEGAISHMIPEPADTGRFGEDAFALCIAQIEAHFFANHLFLEPDYIVLNAPRIAGIPIHVVHGRYDQVCPLTQASRLVDALAKAGAAPATYVRTNAGHSAMERENVVALTAIMDGLPAIAVGA